MCDDAIRRETDRFVREEMKLTGRRRQQMEDKLFALVSRMRANFQQRIDRLVSMNPDERSAAMKEELSRYTDNSLMTAAMNDASSKAQGKVSQKLNSVFNQPANEFGLDAQIEQGLKEGKITLKGCAKCGEVNPPIKTQAGVTFCAKCQNEFLEWIAGSLAHKHCTADGYHSPECVIEQLQKQMKEFTRADIDTARQEGRDEVLKLAAKIVAKLEIAMTPDFATQIEQALREDMR